jgi:predicted DNA-binding protein with PD1-like motif
MCLNHGSRSAIHWRSRKTFALVFESGDEVIEQLTGWCQERGITAARLTGVGAFSEATIAWFDCEAREFREIPVTEQVELLALSGDVAEQDGMPAIHVHVVLGTRDGSARGGHLTAARVRPTLELVVDEVLAHLRKRPDPKSGLALIALED